VDPQTVDGLPRRVRRASLAPQLRHGAGPSTVPVDWSGTTANQAPGTGADHPWGDTGYVDEVHQPPWSGHDDDGIGTPAPGRPERVRSLMSALQTGLARGRREGRDPWPDSGGLPPLSRTALPAHHQHDAPKRGTDR
jgi:hypothetical protein